MSELLRVTDLSVAYPTFALHPLSFGLEAGEILTIIGESGSGKTTIAHAVACMTDPAHKVTGSVVLDGVDLFKLEQKELQKLRLSLFSLVYQNSTDLLNPTLTLGGHLEEVLKGHLPKGEIKEKMEALMTQVGLEVADLKRYPREISGGMTQRFLLANALAREPKLVILDEPTSALDVDSQEEFVQLIRHLNQSCGIAFLMITHDLQLAKALSQRMIVLYEGHIQEMGTTAQILSNPRHPYTRGLIHASAHLNLTRDLWGIRPPSTSGGHRHHHGCPFCSRCTQSLPHCHDQAPHLEPVGDRHIACNRGGIVTLLEGREITKNFDGQPILNGVNLQVFSGEIVSIIGRSGIGKTTLARIFSGFLQPDSGNLEFLGEKADHKKLHSTQGGLQMVFQDSQSALNPHFTVAQAIGEPRKLAKLAMGNAVQDALQDVGLPTTDVFLSQQILSLSGGQKQRVALARALTMEPSLLIADEPTASLDVSSKANLLRMLKGLQNRRGLSLLMITHDLECAFKISDRIFRIASGNLTQVDTEQYVNINFEKIFD